MKKDNLQFLSPAELYSRLLHRQLKLSGADLASIWVRDEHGIFLYAAAGDECADVHSELYPVCEQLALRAIESCETVEDRQGGKTILAVPIVQDESPYACSLLWTSRPEGFESEPRELAVVSADAFSLYMEKNHLFNSVTRLSEGCLTLSGVTKSYGEGEGMVQALKGINLSIRRGELLVILGMSGSGKSTLLNIIGGMTHPTSGSVIVEGQDLSAASPRELTVFRRSRLGFVFQFYNLIADLTAAENVGIAANMSNHPIEVDQALDFVGLREKKNKYPSQLSGGEQQRVSIARAIVKRPDFLLCDEPTGALDVDTGKQVLRIIADFVKEPGHTVVIVTHCAAMAGMADRVIRIQSGRVVEEYLNPEKIRPEEIEW